MEVNPINLHNNVFTSTNSIIHSSNDIIIDNSNNSGDIDSSIHDNRTLSHGSSTKMFLESSVRICDDGVTLEDLIKEERSLMMLFMILGFYIDDSRNSIGLKILARSWQFCLLLFGGMGFVWFTFVEGGRNIRLLHDTITSSSSTSVAIFIQCGWVLFSFITPLMQVVGVTCGIYNSVKEMRHLTFRTDNLLRNLRSRKILIFRFFIFLVLLIVFVSSFGMTRSYYNNVKQMNGDDYLGLIGDQRASLFIFYQFVTNLFYNLAVTFYLLVTMFFTSVSLKQIIGFQENIISMIETNKLETDNYMYAKNKIITLKDGYYLSTQIVTITAGINVICFMFIIWLSNFYYIQNNITSYSTVIFYDFYQLPYLLKGYICHYHITTIFIIINIITIEIVFFFYILYQAGFINTLHDAIINSANDKYWEVKKKNSNIQDFNDNKSDIQLMWDCAVISTEHYSIFKIGPYEVRQRYVFITMIIFISYCASILLKFKADV